MPTIPCTHCGYQGNGHYVGCNRPRTSAELSERAILEARIAAAWANDNA